MRGSLRSRRPGVWELIIQLPRDPITGRPQQVSSTVHGTKRDAKRALAAEIALVSARKVTATTQTVGELLSAWYEKAAGDLSPSTSREYRRLIDKRLLPVFGRIRVLDLPRSISMRSTPSSSVARGWRPKACDRSMP